VGYISGNMIYNLEVITFPGDPNTIYIITISIMSILGYFLAKYIDKLIIIIATSLLGAYIFVRVRFQIYKGTLTFTRRICGRNLHL
jgi:hypothetical protein